MRMVVKVYQDRYGETFYNNMIVEFVKMESDDACKVKLINRTDINKADRYGYIHFPRISRKNLIPIHYNNMEIE